MKKRLFLIIIFALQSQILFSQSGWVVQNSGTTELLRSVFFINSNTGWACGNSGIITKTTNGGINWIQQTSGIDQNLNSIFFLNENTGWSCGGKVTPTYIYMYCILKTTNSGSSWQIVFNQVSNFTIFFKDIHFINANSGIVIAAASASLVSRGLMMKSTNGGMNWTSSPEDSLSRYALTFANSSTGYLCCSRFSDNADRWTLISYILKTTNYGTDWATVHTGNNFSVRTLSCADANNVLGGGLTAFSAGVIYKSQNGGGNWIEVSPQSSGEIYSVFSADTNFAWAVTYDKKILMSSNGGLNWVNQQNPVNLILNDLYFVNSLTGWAVGNSGTILKTTTGGITGFKPISNTIPDRFILSQNYPNPFNPVTKIKFDIPSKVKSETSNAPLSFGEGQGVRLIIYDAIGREITTLVNEQLKPGSYEVEFDGSNYPSGVYFYQLSINNEQLATKKMVLIK